MALIVNRACFVLFGLGGLFFVICGIAGDDLTYGAVGLACLAYAKAADAHSRLDVTDRNAP